MFITPQVIESELDLKGVIDDLRKKMVYMDQLFPVKPVASGPPAQPMVAEPPPPAPSDAVPAEPPAAPVQPPMTAPQPPAAPAQPPLTPGSRGADGPSGTKGQPAPEVDGSH